MKEILAFFFLSTVLAADTHDANCTYERLPEALPAPRLTHNVSDVAADLVSRSKKNQTLVVITRLVLSRSSDILGVLIFGRYETGLALNVSGRMKVFLNRTAETDAFWKAQNLTDGGWGKPFKECSLLGVWLYHYFYKSEDGSYRVHLFVRIDLNQCDDSLSAIYNGSHRCDRSTMQVSS